MRKVLSVVLAAALLGGCAVGPHYRKPLLEVPHDWMTHLTGKPEAPLMPGQQWWQAYHDPLLNTLVEAALANNGDVKVAEARINKARAGRLGAAAALLPEVGGTAQVTRGPNAQALGKVDTTSLLGFTADWELDLFGGHRRALQAANANLAAARSGADGVLVSVLAETANSYFALQAAQEQVSLTTRLLALQQRTDDLVGLQYKAGAVSGRDVAQSTAQTQAVAAQLATLKQAEVAQRMSLIALTGVTPTLVAEVGSVSEVIPFHVLVDAPASVIANRPDVRVAERQLAAATANEGVAMSNWFPSISLSGLFGWADSQQFGGSHAWDAGGVVSLPILNFGRVRALVNTAKARQKEALATYEQTVRDAVADVETALAGVMNSQDGNVASMKAADAAERSAELADASYRAGAISLTDLLLAQQTALQVELNASGAKAQAQQAFSNLYRAVGSY